MFAFLHLYSTTLTSDNFETTSFDVDSQYHIAGSSTIDWLAFHLISEAHRPCCPIDLTIALSEQVELKPLMQVLSYIPFSSLKINGVFTHLGFLPALAKQAALMRLSLKGHFSADDINQMLIPVLGSWPRLTSIYIEGNIYYGDKVDEQAITSQASQSLQNLELIWQIRPFAPTKRGRDDLDIGLERLRVGDDSDGE